MMCKKYESAIKRKKQSKEMIFKNLWYLLDRQTVFIKVILHMALNDATTCLTLLTDINYIILH